jgi:hypothetical protein
MLLRGTPDPHGTSTVGLRVMGCRAMPVKTEVTTRAASDFGFSRHAPYQPSLRLLTFHRQRSVSSFRQQPWLAEGVAVESDLPVISNAAIRAGLGNDFFAGVTFSCSSDSWLKGTPTMAPSGGRTSASLSGVQRISDQGGGDATTRMPKAMKASLG